jgi:hypothetical protein
VLWDLGILPDVRVLPEIRQGAGGTSDAELPQTRPQAVEMALQGGWLPPEDRERARSVLDAHYHTLFSETPAGIQPLWPPVTRELLITWEKDRPH